ncbi:A-kinase anchor protein 13 isoform X2 [Gouania willdenowi]|uniref:A-kinase anchor protein 13 isoform X2 n=1 Tax=Gouania willdenowi TaxID=441366 RepID=UPI00105655DE|nr:A-kinase anchor protein 13 isoform X2 [Gouania willdenowi]
MKLNPQQAPLYGQCVVTVQLADEELAAADEGVDYFLLFAGSTQRHLTATERSSHDTLLAQCPAHNCCEVVLVTLFSLSRQIPEGSEDHKLPLGRVSSLAEHRFSFVQDLAFDMAQFLVSTAGRADGLDGALLLDECQIPLQECERLDESLALALHHLTLPPGWSLLGTKPTNSTDLKPQETLLHFSARRGLFRVTRFLLHQPGAREALRLANRQGETPISLAAARGHECLYELLIKAEADTETLTDRKTSQPVSLDARLFCHQPRLNTHTLTETILPGCNTPTLQESVEQLLHSTCYHAKGVSVVDVHLAAFNSTVQRIQHVDAQSTSLEQLNQPACLDSLTEEGAAESLSVNSCGTANSGHGVTGIAENQQSLSFSNQTSELLLREHGLGPPEDWVCLSSNADREKCQMKEEEGRERPVSTQSLSDRSEAVQKELREESLTVGILPPANCVEQGEEADRGEAVIREGEEARKGDNGLEQEAEDSTGRRREGEGEEEEEESNSESLQPQTTGEDTKEPVMGQHASSQYASDSSDSDVEEEEDNVEKEDSSLDLYDRLSVKDEDVGNEELTESVSAPRDLPNPLLIEPDDVIKETDAAAPCLLIEGLLEGEPPPDINNPEQNQETAGRDYAALHQWDCASLTGSHSGNCTGTESSKDTAELCGFSIESNSLSVDNPGFRTSGNCSDDLLDCEKMLTNELSDQEPNSTQSISSDDDGSFRSVRSSTSEIFQPSQDDGTIGDEYMLQTMRVELNDQTLYDSKEQLENEDESGTDNGLAVRKWHHDGTEPDSPLTIEPLTPAGTEKLAVELSNEDPPLESTVVKSEETGIDVIETGESKNTGIGVEIKQPIADTNKVVTLAEEDMEVDKVGDESAVVAVVESGIMLPELKQPQLDTSVIEANESSLSESVDVSSSDANLASASTEPSTDAQPEDQSETLETCDSVDGALESGSSDTLQEVNIISSEEAVEDVAEEESSPLEETIHRDREASFHQPCNTEHSETSALPTLSSRSSSSTTCPSSAHRDSGSDTESFLSVEPGYDGVFTKNDEPVTGGDSTSEVSISLSSTDDTASVGLSSSSPEGSQGLSCSWSPEEGVGPDSSTTTIAAAAAAGLDGASVGGGDSAAAGEVDEEAKDKVTEVPRRSCLVRSSARSVSPLRRHSWGPGKNHGGDAEMNQRSSLHSSGEGKSSFHRSYSLEGLSGAQEELRSPPIQGPQVLEPLRVSRQDSEERGSLVSLTEEQEDGEERSRRQGSQKLRRYRPLRNSCPPMSLPLTKSVSMLAISQRDIDGMKSYTGTSGSLAYSISEEEPGPLRSDTEGKGVTKVSRTFSYLKNKMYKKTREKEKEKKEKEKETKEKDKKTINGHLYTILASNQAPQCSQCNKAFNNKEAFYCSYCTASVHKGCRDSLPACAKVKMKLPKQQSTVPDSASFPTVTMRSKSGGTRERPWSAILSPEDHSSLVIPSSRRPTSIMSFHGNNLSKSLSISNIAGPVFDEIPIKGLRYLSQSTDSLNRTNQVTESMESLTDEGTEMMDGQLMGEFEADAKEFESDSWSICVEQQYLQHLDKELVKRQDIIYELMQTEMHHIRTLRIMSEVYSKGLQKEVQLEQQTLEKLLPVLDDLLELHTQLVLRLLERKKDSQLESGSLEGGFVISRIGDILVSQFSGSTGESMKRVYGRFCSRHNEAVNIYKDLLTKDKRFKAFMKKKMSSSIVRRLGIPECILLVTQRITKYPVLIQRMLQHTKVSDEDYDDLVEAIRLVKEVIASVDSKVNEHDKKRRLREFHSRTDSKSIMMMKSGQIFAREDLLRRRLIHDGALQLKNMQGRLKEVHALLLSDVFVFLQEKDQKYIFAMLDQRSTVISLQKLIVREVANEDRGLFFITAGIEKPEMMEVLASSKDERNTWMQLIQEAMQSMEKDEDEGIPSETEDDKRQLESKTKEMRDMLRQKDAEIMSLLEEKVRLFRGMWEGLNPSEETCWQTEPFFRSASSLEVPRGASIMKDALQEVETLQTLVNGSLGGAMASIQEGRGGGGGGGGVCGGAGPVCLPRRAETFGGFDSHQMHSNKSGDREESEDMVVDLRRTESDSVLKKGGNAGLMLLKRNSEQLLQSISNLHLLLSSLQAVVVQQDSFIEDQRQALSERSSSLTSLTRTSSRPSSLVEQEKQRSLEKQRQEMASLQRQQAAHAEERRRREREWDLREQQLSEREGRVHRQEEEIEKQNKQLEEEKQDLQSRTEKCQKDLERLREAQRKLDREKEAVQRQLHKMEGLRGAERTSSTTSDESQFAGSSRSLGELDPLDLPPASSMSLPRLPTQISKPKGKGLNPFTSSSTNMKGSETNNQISRGLLQLTKNKNKDGKEKKKKKNKGGSTQPAEAQSLAEPSLDEEIFFC